MKAEREPFAGISEDWDGEPLPGTLFVGADDGATLMLAGICVSVPETPGPYGGSPYTTKTLDGFSLMPGVYDLSLSYFNVDYPGPEANLAVLDCSISPAGTIGEVIPEDNDETPDENPCICPVSDAGGVGIAASA